MKRILHLGGFLLLSALLLGSFSHPVSAQNNEDYSLPSMTGGSGNSGGGSSLNIQTTGQGDIYYIDRVGLQFFMSQSNQPLEDFISDVDYNLGPNDVLSIEVEGSVQILTRAAVVDAQGYLFLPMAGKVYVGNLNIDEAKQTIKKAYLEELKEAKVNLSLLQPRPITVHLTGNVSNPGKYTVPAGTRLDKIVFPQLSWPSSGGGKDSLQTDSMAIGSKKHRLLNSKLSVRNVRIEHKNGSTTKGDLIGYLLGGNIDKNPFLKNGDLVKLKRVYPTDPEISISGAVSEPIETEYRPGDNLEDLLSIAGGYLTGADTTSIVINRMTGGELEKVEIDFSETDPASYKVKPNDRVVVPYLDNVHSQSAWVQGEVSNPGNYPIIEGKTTAFKLMDMAGGLNNEALPNGAYIIRNPSKDRRVKPAMKFSIDELKRTSDQLVQGLQYIDMEGRTPSNRIYVDLRDKEKLKQIKLADGDRLFIPRNYNSVILYGQVNRPGYYTYAKGHSIQDYIEEAGGKTIASREDRVFIIKAGSRAWYKPEDTTVESGDIIFVDRFPLEDLNEKRQYEIQQRNLRKTNIQIIIAAVGTVASAITTLVAVSN